MPHDHENEYKEMVDITKADENKTAFYLQNSIKFFPNDDFRTIYINIFESVRVELRKGTDAKIVSMALMAMMYDLMSATLVLTDYSNKELNPENNTLENDIQNFMGSFITMTNHVTDAINVNGNLMKNKRSIFNVPEQKLDS